MRKILIALIMVVILVFTGVTVVNGIQIGNFEILGISKHSFAGDCRSLNIDINTNYKTATRLKSEEYKRKCFQYKSEMEVNNQNWCKSEWAQFLNVSWNAVDRFCESENITLPNKRNRSKKL